MDRLVRQNCLHLLLLFLPLLLHLKVVPATAALGVDIHGVPWQQKWFFPSKAHELDQDLARYLPETAMRLGGVAPAGFKQGTEERLHLPADACHLLHK